MYLVISIGVLTIRSSIVIVDTLDGVSRRLAQHRGWLAHYDHLRPLVPTFRACLEYTLWIGLWSLALLQIQRFDVVAVWGPKLIQGIGIFFLSAVVIELGRLEIARRMLAQDGADEMTRRRRATMAPLVRTAFTYSVYFGGGVLITLFGLSTMTVRTSTRVRPGRQDAMAAALRLSIKEAFDREASTVERTGLVPQELFARRAR